MRQGEGAVEGQRGTAGASEEADGRNRQSALSDQSSNDADDPKLVLTDAAPIAVSAETEYLARFADCAIVVIESGVTTRAEIRDAAATLQRLNVGTVGFVLNRVGMTKADPSFRASVDAIEKHLQSQMGAGARRSKRTEAFPQARGANLTLNPGEVAAGDLVVHSQALASGAQASSPQGMNPNAGGLRPARFEADPERPTEPAQPSWMVASGKARQASRQPLHLGELKRNSEVNASSMETIAAQTHSVQEMQAVRPEFPSSENPMGTDQVVPQSLWAQREHLTVPKQSEPSLTSELPTVPVAPIPSEKPLPEGDRDTPRRPSDAPGLRAEQPVPLLWQGEKTEQEKTSERLTSRLSGLRNLLTGLGLKEIHSSAGTLNSNNAPRTPLDRGRLPAEDSMQSSLSNATSSAPAIRAVTSMSREVSAKPEFLKPAATVAEDQAEDSTEGKKFLVITSLPIGEFEEPTLPSRRGQYRNR